MDGTAIKAMMAEIAPVIRDYVAEAQAPLLERISTLETERVALASRCAALEETAGKVVEIDLAPVEKLIEAEIAKIPPPEPAKEVNREELAALVSEAVAAIPAPQDGQSVHIEDVIPAIVAEVERAVAAIPIPKDGEPGEPGKDAAGIVEALKDSGELVLTLQDGRLIRTGVRDGEKGKDGRDGFELTDYDEWFEDDGRTLVRRFTVGEDFKEFRHQTVLPRYRQVFKEGEAYTRGDIVTWGGHAWHCDKDTTAKPDSGDWSQMVKKGRDGKDAK